MYVGRCVCVCVCVGGGGVGVWARAAFQSTLLSHINRDTTIA